MKQEWYSEYDSAGELGPLRGTIEGSLPTELRGGTFFRNGPGNFERGEQRYKHVIDGDGLILRISFPDGDSDTFEALARFVRTPTFVEEERRGLVCARSSFGTQRKGLDSLANVFDTSLKNVANTHVVPWGGKLLALYETGLPYRLEPKTLRMLGLEDFGGKVTEGPAVSLGNSILDEALGFGSAVTAHPHVDDALEHLIIWSARNRFLDGVCEFRVSEWDRQWEEKNTCHFDMKAGVNPHDFAFTKSYYIWVENRMALKEIGMASYLLGLAGPAESVEADASAPTRVHLVSRAPAGGVVRHLVVDTPPWFSIHQSHAEETTETDGSVAVTIYSAGWTGEGLSQNDGKFLAAWAGYAPDFDVIPATFYWRTRVRVAAGGASAELVEHCVCPGAEGKCIDHPHVDPREEGGPGAQYAYMTYCNEDGLSSPSIGWLRLDLRNGESTVWSSPKQGGCFAQEPVVVPKAEGAGSWVLAMLNDHRRNASCLCVLDGDDFACGPICRLWLPSRVPHALHGSFQPASQEPDRMHTG